MTWSVVYGADSYHVQISNSSMFDTLFVDADVGINKYQWTGLVPNSTYYWRVNAQEDGASSEWSPVCHYYVGLSTFVISYSWYYGGQTWTLEKAINGGDYYKYHEQTRNYNFASYVTDEDPWVKAIAYELHQAAKSKGYSSIQEAEFILKFVQNIPYALDEDTTGQMEYPRYSVETLVDRCGDCEDLSVLYASIMQADPINIDTVLLEFHKSGSPGHMATGLWGSGLTGKYYSYNGRDFYYCETTNASYNIGVFPTTFLNGYICTVLPC
jgi:hypothetical protein